MAFKIGEAARKRCAEECRQEYAKRHADLLRRLRALVLEHGPDSLYGDMLADYESVPGRTA